MERSQADIQFAFENLCKEYDRHFRLPLFEIESGSDPRHGDIRIETDFAVPMRDGVRLYADLYRPDTEAALPVILVRMPYGKQEFYCYMPAIGRFWARRGYAFVVQDVRGRFVSEGVWEPHVNESNDGFDTLDWITRQPWCNGRIGMMGESYYGYTCWAAAVSAHPQLVCIAPSTTAMNIYNGWVYNDGAYCLQSMGDWSIAMNSNTYQNTYLMNHRHLPLKKMACEAGLKSPYFDQCLAHPTRDEFWERINLDQFYDRIRIPVLHLGGWYDLFLRATLADWGGITTASHDEAHRSRQWLCIGPADHEYTTEENHRVGRFNIGTEAARTRWRIQEQFFDFWLRGEDNGFDRRPRVSLFVMGPNQWRSENEWPLARTQFRRYYFHSSGGANSLYGDGRLDTAAPGDEPCDRYTYDPLNPVSISQETDLWRLAQEMRDRRPVEIRNDVLIYTSDVLKQDLEITGPVAIRLLAASSARDTDFTGTLVDVFPDGYAHLIQEGIIRASFRDADRAPRPINPGRAYAYTIDLGATSWVVKKGHRIRIEISSSNFDRFDCNPNTGERFAESGTTIEAAQTVFHDRQHPSYVILPVIAAADEK